MTPKERAGQITALLDDKRAVDIRMLELIDLTVLTDYFVICTGNSTTHVKSLAGEVEKKLKDEGVYPHHIEGYLSGGWILMDYGAIVVHIFMAETREFYSIERLWTDAKVIPIGEHTGGQAQ